MSQNLKSGIFRMFSDIVTNFIFTSIKLLNFRVININSYVNVELDLILFSY